MNLKNYYFNFLTIMSHPFVWLTIVGIIFLICITVKDAKQVRVLQTELAIYKQNMAVYKQAYRECLGANLNYMLKEVNREGKKGE